MDAKLRVVGGPLSGQSIPVSRNILIGRAVDCDLQLSSEFVSSYHCVLLLDEFTLRIRDLGSKNGTLVNGCKIGTSVKILSHDDMVLIGDLILLVDINQATARAQPSDSGSQAEFSSTAMEATGFFADDTVQADSPGSIPQQPAPPDSTSVILNATPPSPDQRPQSPACND